MQCVPNVARTDYANNIFLCWRKMLKKKKTTVFQNKQAQKINKLTEIAGELLINVDKGYLSC